MQALHFLLQPKAENSNACTILGSLVRGVEMCWLPLWVRQHLRLWRPLTTFICNGKCCTAKSLTERVVSLCSLRTAWPNNTPHPALPFYLREYAWCHRDQTDSFSPQIRFGLSVQSCVSAVEWLSLCQQKKADERNDWYSRKNQQDTDNNSKVLCANLSRWQLKVFFWG